MGESIREFTMRTKQCICGVVDPEGGPDFAGNGLYWHCRACLDRRDEVASLPSQRVTISEVL